MHMYARVYVCMYARVYVCIHIQIICAYIEEFDYLLASNSTFCCETCLHAYMHDVCAHVCVCMSAYTQITCVYTLKIVGENLISRSHMCAWHTLACMHVCVCVCKSVFTGADSYVCINVCVLTYLFMHTCE